MAKLFHELGWDDCCALAGGGSKDAPLFCGETRKPGFSCCAKHTREFYEPIVAAAKIRGKVKRLRKPSPGEIEYFRFDHETKSLQPMELEQ